MERNGYDIAREIARKEAINSAGSPATRKLADAMVVLIDTLLVHVDDKEDEPVMVPVATMPSGAEIKADPTSAHYTDIAQRMQLLERVLRERDDYRNRYDAVVQHLRHDKEATERAIAERAKMADALHTAMKQRDVTQEQLERFTSACADQAIQIMELRGELQRERDVRSRDLKEHADDVDGKAGELLTAWRVLADQPWRDVVYWSEPGDDIAEAIRKRDASWRDVVTKLGGDNEELRKRAEAVVELQRIRDDLQRLNDVQASTRRDIEAAYQRGVNEWRDAHPEAAGSLPPSRGDVVAWALSEIESLREQLQVADSDRVPLAQDLDIVREELRIERERSERMERCIAAVRVGGKPSVLVDVVEQALEDYEKACSAAANAEQDDSGVVVTERPDGIISARINLGADLGS